MKIREWLRARRADLSASKRDLEALLAERARLEESLGADEALGLAVTEAEARLARERSLHARALEEQDAMLRLLRDQASAREAQARAEWERRAEQAEADLAVRRKSLDEAKARFAQATEAWGVAAREKETALIRLRETVAASDTAARLDARVAETGLEAARGAARAAVDAAAARLREAGLAFHEVLAAKATEVAHLQMEIEERVAAAEMEGDARVLAVEAARRKLEAEGGELEKRRAGLETVWQENLMALDGEQSRLEHQLADRLAAIRAGTETLRVQGRQEIESLLEKREALEAEAASRAEAAARETSVLERELERMGRELSSLKARQAADVARATRAAEATLAPMEEEVRRLRIDVETSERRRDATLAERRREIDQMTARAEAREQRVLAERRREAAELEAVAARLRNRLATLTSGPVAPAGESGASLQNEAATAVRAALAAARSALETELNRIETQVAERRAALERTQRGLEGEVSVMEQGAAEANESLARERLEAEAWLGRAAAEAEAARRERALSVGRAREVAQRLSRPASKTPNVAREAFEEGQAALQAGQWTFAAEAFRRAINVNPNENPKEVSHGR